MITTTRSYSLILAAAIAASLQRGEQPPDEVEIVTPFPPAYGHDERFWAAGPYQLQEFTALGDGHYEYSSFSAGGFGGLGLLAMAGGLGITAANKRRARRKAEREATPRWHTIDSGTVALTRYGMYLHNTHGLSLRNWHSIETADIVEPGVVQFSGRSANGPVTFRLVSDWAELAFATWAIIRHPRHPRLLSRDWLPSSRGTTNCTTRPLT